MWRVDLHCHTAGKSYDSSTSLARALADASAAGIDALCLTEHDAFWRPHELIEVALPDPDPESVASAGNRRVALIPGAEINTDCGHVLVFGLTSYRFGFHHPEELGRAVRGEGGAMVLAHPYRRSLPPDASPNSPAYDAAIRRALENPLLKLVDAVETHNGRGSRTENRFAVDLAGLARLPGVAGSDAHHDGEAGRASTGFDSEVRQAEQLSRALRSGRFLPAARSAAAGEPGGKKLQG